ncbi:MAG: hypothetical protein K0Q72_3581 [Armatimonadetes bacterium]|jgi:hypothetical protein|nr:hypothetical protein [Armatimonadota bacterium]
MIRPSRLRPLLSGLVLVLALCGLQRPASALVLTKDVSVKDAKELGITVHAQPRPSVGDVWVKVSFKTTGALKEFTGANLVVVKDGKRLLMADLRARKPAINSAPEEQQLEFYIDPATLPGASVTVISYSQPLTGIGYRLNMSDFVPQPASR